MKYRSRFDIVAAILGGVRAGPSKKTRLMYLSYLSYKQLDDYLTFLLQSGLVTKSLNGLDTQPDYAITERGLLFLHKYEEMVQLLSDLGAEEMK